jgi:hypothetical protein
LAPRQKPHAESSKTFKFVLEQKKLQTKRKPFLFEPYVRMFYFGTRSPNQQAKAKAC